MKVTVPKKDVQVLVRGVWVQERISLDWLKKPQDMTGMFMKKYAAPSQAGSYKNEDRRPWKDDDILTAGTTSATIGCSQEKIAR
jgi:hypothetical protein